MERRFERLYLVQVKITIVSDTGKLYINFNLYVWESSDPGICGKVFLKLSQSLMQWYLTDFVPHILVFVNGISKGFFIANLVL